MLFVHAKPYLEKMGWQPQVALEDKAGVVVWNNEDNSLPLSGVWCRPGLVRSDARVAGSSSKWPISEGAGPGVRSGLFALIPPFTPSEYN